MKWSLKAGRIFGIEVCLHFSFLLLLAFVGFTTWQTTGRADSAVGAVAFMTLLFGCVLLHELGHALMARRFGIKTGSITLLFLGGIARLERMPDKPMQEFAIAAAGPVVNLVIAAGVFLALAATGALPTHGSLSFDSGSVGQRMIAINLGLAAFNLLPAFPMDGGRILRAILASRLGRSRATAAAAQVGKSLAVLFALFGLMHHTPMLVFVAMFVFLGAQAEDRLVKTQSALKGLFVSDAMMTDFRTLSPQDTVSSAAQALLAGSQEDFPVIGQGESFGIVRHSDVFKALTANRREVRVTEIMGSQPESMEESAPLQQAAEAMQARNCPTVLVTRGSQVVGLLTVAKINQRIALEAAFEKTVIAGHTPLPLRLTAVVPALAANCDRLYE